MCRYEPLLTIFNDLDLKKKKKLESLLSLCRRFSLLFTPPLFPLDFIMVNPDGIITDDGGNSTPIVLG